MPSSPESVVRALAEGVPAKRWDDVLELYSDDAHVVHPLQLPEPVPIVGKAALREHFARAAELPIEMQTENLVIHRTADPEVVVAEFDYTGTVTTSGAMFRVSNIFVVRVRDGRIVESRDYANHALLGALLRPGDGSD